jgi:hypothetical protein
MQLLITISQGFQDHYCDLISFASGDEPAIVLRCPLIGCYLHIYSNTLVDSLGERGTEMPRKTRHPPVSAPRFRVGDKVKFTYVTIPVIGEVKEDRGNLGVNGRRLYGIWYALPDTEPSYTEIPEEELEPAN